MNYLNKYISSSGGAKMTELSSTKFIAIPDWKQREQNVAKNIAVIGYPFQKNSSSAITLEVIGNHPLIPPEDKHNCIPLCRHIKYADPKDRPYDRDSHLVFHHVKDRGVIFLRLAPHQFTFYYRELAHLSPKLRDDLLLIGEQIFIRTDEVLYRIDGEKLCFVDTMPVYEMLAQTCIRHQGNNIPVGSREDIVVTFCCPMPSLVNKASKHQNKGRCVNCGAIHLRTHRLIKGKPRFIPRAKHLS